MRYKQALMAYGEMNETVLEVRNLSISFRDGGGERPAVRSVQFSVRRGEILAVVGESGSGKTTMALGLCRLLDSPPALYHEGQVIFRGQDLLNLPERELQTVRGGAIGYVFQEPSLHLNPLQTVGKQILEVLRQHRPLSASSQEVVRLLQQVCMPNPVQSARLFPFELSGGMQQRALIAMALAGQPSLLIADEPTSALDTPTQRQILLLLEGLRQNLSVSIIIISHHIGAVAEIADSLAVMYAGTIVESGPARRVLRSPLHPYTVGLLRSVPQIQSMGIPLQPIPGVVPALSALPTGCKFHPRCSRVQDDCRTEEPEFTEVLPQRFVRCPYWK